MNLFRKFSETLARKTTRRGFFGRGADVAFGTLIGAAAGVALRPDGASAGIGSACAFPGPPCCRENCLDNGTCAKPCLINTTWYAGGCWVTASVTCCDCTCQDIPSSSGFCGCGTDYHNVPDQFGGYPSHCADSPTPTPTFTPTETPETTATSTVTPTPTPEP